MIRYSFDLDSFVCDHLQGDWRSLADLSLTEMQYSPHLYGFPLDFKDCDETGFMWEIYNRIWGAGADERIALWWARARCANPRCVAISRSIPSRAT